MDENLEWLTQNTEDLKSNKGNLTFPPQSNKEVATASSFLNQPPFSGLPPLSS